MMKLSSITIQGMHNVSNKTYSLGNFTYFIGENGAGKSTVLQAIQLALLGYIPGTDKKKSAIFHHANGVRMSVELHIDADTYDICINRTWVKSGKDIVTTVTTTPEDLDIASIIGDLALPVFNFNEFMGMSANKMKDWFINFLPSASSEIDWDTVLKDEIKDFGTILSPEFVGDTIDYAQSMETTGLEQIREFNTYLKNLQSFKKSELQRVQNTIQSLIYYDDFDASEDADTLRSLNYQDNLIKESINKQLILIAQNEHIQNGLKSVCEAATFDSIDEDATYQENQSEIERIESEMNVIEASDKVATSSSTKLVSQISYKQSIIDSNGVCPYIKSACATIAEKIELLKAEISDLNDDLVAINHKAHDNKRKLKELHDAKFRLEQRNQNIRNAYSRRDTLRSQMHKDVVGLDAESLKRHLDDISQAIAQRTETIIKLEANKKYNELVEDITSEKYQIEQEIEILKAWIKLTDVNGLQSQIMNVPFNNLSENVSKYLTKFFGGNTDYHNAMFYLSNTANSFSFGIRNAEGKYIEFDLLSSGEKCLYTLALLISLIESSNTKLPILLIDDLLDHLDRQRIDRCFETLYDTSSVQIILAGVQNCNHTDSDEFVVEV